MTFFTSLALCLTVAVSIVALGNCGFDHVHLIFWKELFDCQDRQRQQCLDECERLQLAPTGSKMCFEKKAQVDSWANFRLCLNKHGVDMESSKKCWALDQAHKNCGLSRDSVAKSGRLGVGLQKTLQCTARCSDSIQSCWSKCEFPVDGALATAVNTCYDQNIVSANHKLVDCMQKRNWAIEEEKKRRQKVRFSLQTKDRKTI